MTCAFTLGPILGSSFGATSVIVNEPGSAFGDPSGAFGDPGGAFGDPSGFGVRAVSIRTGPSLSKASQDLSHDAAFPLLMSMLLTTILGRVVIAYSRRNAE
jgi:hypothetical protein